MAGVSKQRDSTLAPAIHWAPSHEGPFGWCGNVLNHHLDIPMPAAEIVREFVGCAFDGPRFDLPVIPFNDTHEIHQRAATNRIVKQMAAWAEPIDPDRVGN